MSISRVTNDLQVAITNRQILKIALPISFALFVPQINFITNNIFLGQLGEQELGVAGLTGVYYLIFAAIGFGLNNGLQALISRRAGENRVDEIGILFSQGVRIALVIAATGMTAFAALKGWQEWLDVRRSTIESRRRQSPRRTIADLRERVRRLEAIANGTEG